MKCPVSESYTIRMEENGEIKQWCQNCRAYHTNPLNGEAHEPGNGMEKNQEQPISETSREANLRAPAVQHEKWRK